MAPSAALVAAMIAWVSQITGLPPAPAPRIEISAMAPGPDAAHPRHLVDRQHQGLWGLAMPGIIYLDPSWDGSSALDRSILAHELTHVLDYASGRPHRCTAEMERIAYAVQEYYLANAGINFWQVARYTPATLAKVEECPNG